MRRAVLRTLLSFAATAMAAQIATGIHLQEVYFTGNTRLEGVNLQKCASELKSKVYAGPEWTDYVIGVVQTQCLMDKGYLKPAVKASTQQLPDKNNTHQFRITFDIDAGSRYRLGHITFKDNHAISDSKALRGLFPIKDDSIYDRQAIATGFENLSLAYGEMGYINFTSIPTPTFDDGAKVAFLEIYVDEGKQFRVSTIDILGADVEVLNDLGLKPGEVYNARLVNLFLRKHLPGAHVNDPRFHRTLNERNGTVALTFDFRSRTE
jgi:outer membrane protein assembly factor BamA